MRINGKTCWLFWLTIVLMTLLLPRQTLAQEGKINLTLRLVSDSYYNKVTVGKDNLFFLEVRNTGDRAITNISLSSQRPEGWAIEFKPERIDYLSAGSLQTVDVNVKPASDTDKGEYGVTIIAEASETRKSSAVRFTVETDRAVWLWGGVALVFVVAATFIVLFLRSNRQRVSES